MNITYVTRAEAPSKQAHILSIGTSRRVFTHKL